VALQALLHVTVSKWSVCYKPTVGQRRQQCTGLRIHPHHVTLLWSMNWLNCRQRFLWCSLQPL